GIRDSSVTGVQTCALPIYHRLRAQVANAGLEADAALRRDDQKSVEADGAADVATERHADAAHLCTDPLRIAAYLFAPFELHCAEIGRASCRERGSMSGGPV